MRILLLAAALATVLSSIGCASSGGAHATAQAGASANASDANIRSSGASVSAVAKVAATNAAAAGAGVSPDLSGSTSVATITRLASAIANLSAASASLVSGRLTFTPADDGVQVKGTIGGLRPNGIHALHIHEQGDCSAADASSAGGHFNPDAQPHGRNKIGPRHHAGDNDNLRANSEGVASIDTHFAGVALGGGGTDVVGKAIVVHADPDDYATQSAGNAGVRIACGIITGG